MLAITEYCLENRYQGMILASGSFSFGFGVKLKIFLDGEYPAGF